MKPSESRLSHLAHLVVEGLRREGLADFRDPALALRSAKESLARIFSAEDEVDDLVRRRLAKQNKVPGSREWQLLYERYFREEMHRRGW